MQESQEAKILFPGEQVGPYRFRPWTLEQFSLLIGVVEKVVEAVDAAGMGPEIIKLAALRGEEKEAAETALKNKMLKIIPPAIAPHLAEIISVTMKIPPAEVEQIPPGFRLALGLRIITNSENMELVKNFFAGFSGI